MEIDKRSPSFLAAMRDFRRARQRAVLEKIVAHLTGKSADLLAYEEVRQQLKARHPVRRGLQEIPLDAIVGSVGRYGDFTRSFLPRRKSDEEHWAEVKAAVTDLGKIPPITLYQVGEVYFVLDGNHRVSIARQLGRSHIPAYVTEIQTGVPLSADVQPDQLINQARYAEFLEQTGLDQLRPQADLSVTVPGQYRLLKEQIDIHRRWLSGQREEEVPYQEAVGHWYDEVYWPVIQIIRERGILRYFPGRTETDLYVWIFRHQAELKEILGWEVGPKASAEDLVAQFSHQPQPLLNRLKEKVVDILTPDPLEAGPPPGQWRKEQLATHQNYCLFSDILCVMPDRDEETGRQTLEQALVVAQKEGGRLHGLSVTASAARQDNVAVRARQARFKARCQTAGVEGELAVEVGNVARTVCDRARWTDLIVVNPLHPPGPRPGARLRSGFGTLIRRCGRPILVVANDGSPLDRALLAYDGSPKANEALFVAAYLAGRWQIPLVALTVIEGERVTAKRLADARRYLETRQVEAAFVTEQGSVVEAIQKTAAGHKSNLIIMGGYGFSPVLEVVLGSAVDEVVRMRQWPVLICR